MICDRCGHRVVVLSVGGICETCVRLDAMARPGGRILSLGCGRHMGELGWADRFFTPPVPLKRGRPRKVP